METGEDFKRVLEIISTLKNQKAFCEEIVNTQKETREDVEKNIEKFFAKCVDVLAARKVALLVEVDKKLKEQEKEIERTKEKINKAIEGSNEILGAGIRLYDASKEAAEYVWKGIVKLPLPGTDVGKVGRIKVEFHDSFLPSISSLGTVVSDTAPNKASAKILASPLLSEEMRVITFAGSSAGLADGIANSAKFNNPRGICFNPKDSCLYVCDHINNLLRKVTLKGEVTTFGTKSIFTPSGIVLNVQEQIFYVASPQTHTIHKITSTGENNVFSGRGKAGYIDGESDMAAFNVPFGIALDAKAGNLYVTDNFNHVVRKIAPSGKVSTLAGSGEAGFQDGKGRNAKFGFPWGIVFDEKSNSLLVCDYGSNRVRRVSLSGEVSTLCEVKGAGFITISESGTILVSSAKHSTIFKLVDKGGQYEAVVFAGSGKYGSVDGKLLESRFSGPTGMVVVNEGASACFVAESNTIRKITLANNWDK